MRKLIPLFLLSVLFILFSCKKDREVINNETQNNGVKLTPDMMKMGHFFGDVFSKKVLIHVQEGPLTKLETDKLKELLKLTERDESFFIFNLHQSQTLTPTKLDADITFEQAKALDQESVDFLSKTIRYFKEQKKEVLVLGVGFGAFVVQELIVREGAEIADQFLIMGGRLDLEDAIWQSYSVGGTGGFINGKTPFAGNPSLGTALEKNSNKLRGGLAYKRYTKELAKYKVLPNVTYAYGTLDEVFGQLTQNEKALLLTRNVKVLEIAANHQKTIESLLDEGFKVAFEK